ncbi:MAG: magnesium transporter [Planctomycetes bacterium]|nr:magnesium transporter [Planctomycetota bacterium]
MKDTCDGNIKEPGLANPPAEPERDLTFPVPEKISPALIRNKLKAGGLAEAVFLVKRLSPALRAEFFLQLRVAEQKALLSAMPPALAASILADCDSASLVSILAGIKPENITPVLKLISPDNLADILLRLPKNYLQEVIKLLDPELSAEVEKLMTFDPESAGGLMTTRYLSVPDVITVGRAIELLRCAKRPDTPSYIYIVDASGRLEGVAPLRGLLLTDSRKSVTSAMVRNVIKLKSSALKKEIIDVFNQYHFISLPVVDEKERLVGIVTFDDVITAMRQSEKEVIQGITGVDPREVFKTTFAVTRSRLPWMTVTIMGGLGCAVIGSFFRDTLAEMVMIGIFIPIILALGESIGVQMTSIVLTTIGDGGIPRAELSAFVYKEFMVSLLIGLYAGVVVSVASVLLFGNINFGLLLSATVFISVCWAALLSLMVSIVMKKLRVNPAVASGPLALALIDMSTMVIYLGSAAFFLSLVK